MKRKALAAGTALSGLIDPSGVPIPSSKVQPDVRDLPLIEASALPPLPDGIEARLYQPEGKEPVIILWWPSKSLSVHVPLSERDDIVIAVQALLQAAGAIMEPGNA